MPISSARKITQKHANSVLEAEKTQIKVPSFAGVEKLIAQIDGSMIPIVETTDLEFEGKSLDRRKTRSCSWREARLCLARAHDCEQLTFGATLGTVDEAGEKLVSSAIRAGMGIDTHVHGLGDGAPWIATQFERVFGSQATYLIDFYHLCDYLAAASERCASKNPQLWRKQQKQYLKTNQVDSVLAALKPYLESDTVPNDKSPVRACYRYLLNRPGQFDYKAAIDADLPIGSGEIESAHRYIIQERQKQSGSWWKLENATTMLALRVLRANGDWDLYWQNIHQQSA